MSRAHLHRYGFVLAAALFGAVSLLASCTSGEGQPGPTGGTPGTGGALGLGGVLGFGGTTAAPAQGGATSGGFTSTAGGSNAGAATAGTAGTASLGGSTGQGGGSSGGGTAGKASGGAPNDPNCVDLPPNNGMTCEHAVEYGWCTMSWLGDSCKKTCNKCNTAAGGSTGAGGSGGNASGGGSGGGGVTPPDPEPPRITNGQSGFATRYWDCCKPACGWKGNVRTGNPMTACSMDNQKMTGNYDAKNACESGGSAYMCWDGHPWEISQTLSYGYAAASGGNYTCGRCYQLQFTGSGANGSPPSPALSNKTMIVQVINNGGLQGNQFDLLIPGGGVGDFDACTRQWGTSDLGARYGGFMLACNGDKNCTKQRCEKVFANRPDLMQGCNWFLGWFNGADNPSFTFKQIACPKQITERSGLSDPG